jgi:hypothetical protein
MRTRCLSESVLSGWLVCTLASFALPAVGGCETKQGAGMTRTQSAPQNPEPTGAVPNDIPTPAQPEHVPDPVARAASPEGATAYGAPGPDEEEPVRAYRLSEADPTAPGAAPNPFVPPKSILTEEDLRAGLDPALPEADSEAP